MITGKLCTAFYTGPSTFAGKRSFVHTPLRRYGHGDSAYACATSRLPEFWAYATLVDASLPWHGTLYAHLPIYLSLILTVAPHAFPGQTPTPYCLLRWLRLVPRTLPLTAPRLNCRTW